jgi:RND family efflux transporter MFP subunit
MRLPEETDNPADQQAREQQRRRMARRLALGVVVVLVLLIGFGAWGVLAQREDALGTTARVVAVPKVRTMIVKPTDTARQLSLSGTMQPVEAATIFARATGYIASRNVDFGSKVKKGDVLAVIAAPDLDQQLAQGKAQLNQAEAQTKLLQATNERTKVLVAQGWQTRQQGDNDALNLQAGIASVKSAAANLARLQQLAQFETVTAPFDGIITNRQIDTGSLVSADTSSGTSMFTIERADILRVQVNVPQDAVFTLKEGGEATVTVPEIPGRNFTGRISRTARSLDPNSRTQLTQVDVENSDGVLRSGLYCQVMFTVPRERPAITLPSQALIFNQHGLAVAVVTEDGKVRIQPVELAQDDGATIEIKTGLSAGDQVILSPPVNVTDGMAVSPQAA